MDGERKLSCHGNPRAAEAILDFWTSDWTSLAARLHKDEVGRDPELFERPILKMGRHLFQLPWVVAVQNNASAAINNLRRLSARRAEARDETRQIEERLARRLKDRGFRVQLNYQPKRSADDDPRGGSHLFPRRAGLVLENKSTFLRRSQKDAWLHGTTTLRKAGLQLRRKVRALEHAITTDADLVSTLSALRPMRCPYPYGTGIVDTSIEHDHERFNGFLKVSLEKVLIALRDDRHC